MTPKCLNQIIGTNALVRILSHFTVIDQDIISELNETGISHELILNQFKAVGSKFTLFSNPFEIFAKLDLLEPIECILKYDLVKVNVYDFNEIVPGKYAPPFPSDAMDDFTKRNTTLFWNEHCFTRITHSKEIN